MAAAARRAGVWSVSAVLPPGPSALFLTGAEACGPAGARCEGARGVGAGLGPIIASRFARGELARVLRICGIAGMVFSVLYLSAAWMPALMLAVVVIAMAHLGGGSQWTLSTYGVQLRSPDHVRGRILAGDFALVTLTLSVTSALAGIASELLGVRQAISVFAIAAALASVTYIKAIQRLRNLPQPQINAEP